MVLTPKSPVAVDAYDSDDDYKDSSAPEPTSFTAQKHPAKEAFDQIIKDAQDNRLILSKKSDRDNFARKYREHLDGRAPPENQTLLHLVANNVGHRPLTKYLIKYHGHLLGAKDDSNKTPLYIAIVRKNVNFLAAIHETLAGRLRALLDIKCEHSRNGIHAAIFHGLDEASTLALIAEASEETLCAKDQDGLTPLHLAVHYSRSSESQYRIVKDLIKEGDTALDVFSTNPAEFSIYEYHQYTGAEALRLRDIATNPNGTANGAPNSTTAAARADGGAAATIRSVGPEGGLLPLPLRTGIHQSLARREIVGQDEADSPPQTRNEGDGEARTRTPTATAVPAPGPGSSRDGEATRKRQDRDRVRDEWAEKIGLEIKLHYLRSTFQSAVNPRPRDQLQAVRFLHGANINDWNLCFDFSKAPTPIDQASFERSFRHMRFDNVLRYVAFHKIELQKPPLKDSKLQAKKLALQPRPGRGRNDLPFFFHWLRGKDVKHILKVVVEDTLERPHSDKAIEESLKHFEVESLEWRKLDICPETLFNACRDVRFLTLWWSGNRALLRAWSEPEGLPKLEKLEAVHLVWNSNEVLESADVIQSYVNDFRIRLESAVNVFEAAKGARGARLLVNGGPPAGVGGPELAGVPMRTITVDPVEETIPNGDRNSQLGTRAKSLSTVNQRNLSSHKWLNCMDKFADEFQNVQVPKTDQETLQKEITVALIDDGVNIDIPTIAGKVIGGATFDRGYPDDNGPSPYFVSSAGHGTVMADMICRVCPMAKLCVFKLETHISGDTLAEGQGHNQIVAKSAAQAVEAAVDRGVDIISISWTVKKPKEKEKSSDVEKLGEAIKKALDSGILVFCAAGDGGAITDQEYPWEFDRSRIIRIGAATDDGRAWERSGDPHKLDFIFPGCDVVSRNPHREGAVPSDFQEKTGSSVATALAAGLAALILHCVRVGAILTEDVTRKGTAPGAAVQAVQADQFMVDQFTSSKDQVHMRSIFESIGLDRDQHKFIEVWNRFEEPADSLKTKAANSPAGFEVVITLARNLVAGIKK